MDRVSIADPSIDDRTKVEEGLTLHLLDFLRDGGFFASIAPLPGRPAATDLVVALRFDNFYQAREIHELYFPLALITLAWYPILGGPVFRDSASFGANLRLATGAGDVIFEGSDQVERSDTVSIWSANYALPSTVAARTEIVQRLFDAASTALTKEGVR